jgi:hypothetical protein
VQLTATNASAAAHTYTMTVEVRGSRALPAYLNVNSDTTYAPLPANWTCLPSENDNPGTDNVFTCTVTLAAGSSTSVMVTTGSTFLGADKGDAINVTTTVTNESNPGSASLPPAVSDTGIVA